MITLCVGLAGSRHNIGKPGGGFLLPKYPLFHATATAVRSYYIQFLIALAQTCTFLLYFQKSTHQHKMHILQIPLRVVLANYCLFTCQCCVYTIPSACVFMRVDTGSKWSRSSLTVLPSLSSLYLSSLPHLPFPSSPSIHDGDGAT